jgi:preprotein translocase subunit SecA
LPARAFASCEAKDRAIACETERLQSLGQPVLIGTAAIETSQRLAALLSERGVAFQLLNGMQDAEEAAIVARAGTLGSVTIATNMAGRGTDIKLSASAEEAGRLHVILTEPQESPRVDRQLVGRAARQGDPGAAQLFVAANDSLFTRHNPTLARQLERPAGEAGELAEPAPAVRGIVRTQQAVEAAKAQHRQQMFAHDDWLERVLSEIA